MDRQTEVQWCQTIKVFKKKSFKDLCLKNHKEIYILKPYIDFVVIHEILKQWDNQRNNPRNNRTSKGTTRELPDEQDKQLEEQTEEQPDEKPNKQDKQWPGGTIGEITEGTAR